MLQFQNDPITSLSTFEDFILTTYVIIDDLYKNFAPPQIANRRHITKARSSDSEIITISICGELLGIDPENAWYAFVKRDHHHLFPTLCSRSRFNRKRRALLRTTGSLRRKMFDIFSAPKNNCFIVDSFPLAVCKFGRAQYCRSFRGYGASYGKCPAKKETYFGYKVHVLVTIEGYIAAYEITSASTDDRDGLKELVEDRKGITVLGDKGYVGEQFREEMAEQGVELLALKRSNSKTNWSKEVRQIIFKHRRKVETVISRSSEQLNAQRVLSKKIQGVETRLENKIMAYDLCFMLNKMLGKNCELGQIKQLIF